MEANDISGALGKLLSDPQALASVMSMAQSLMESLPKEADESSNSEASASAGTEQNTNEPPTEPDSTQPSTAQSAAASLAALAPLLQKGKNGDPRRALLNALKPYMSHGRSEKIDTLINILQIADIAGGLLGGKLF